MQTFILLLVLCQMAVYCISYYGKRFPELGKECKDSNDCPKYAPCCRDKDLNLVSSERISGDLRDDSQIGNCMFPSPSAAGERCDTTCGCVEGYECYRPPSGICCPPPRCYNATWVAEDREYWKNCHPPKCFLIP